MLPLQPEISHLERRLRNLYGSIVSMSPAFSRARGLVTNLLMGQPINLVRRPNDRSPRSGRRYGGNWVVIREQAAFIRNARREDTPGLEHGPLPGGES